jgi:hypothetical protein
MSLTPIIAIRKKLFGAESQEQNKFSQALTLFSKERKLTEVAIGLQLSAEVAEKYYKDFWKLEMKTELCRIYKEHKPYLRLFLYFFKELKKSDLSQRFRCCAQNCRHQ